MRATGGTTTERAYESHECRQYTRRFSECKLHHARPDQRLKHRRADCAAVLDRSGGTIVKMNKPKARRRVSSVLDAKGLMQRIKPQVWLQSFH
jgi:hypothetical protein